MFKLFHPHRSCVLRSSTRASHFAAVSRWMSKPEAPARCTFNASTDHLDSLHFTLPTRDGSISPLKTSKLGNILSPGHQLAFPLLRNPEKALREDGADPFFSPPSPFVRRMWAGGKISWNHKQQIRVGDTVSAVLTMAGVKPKGLDEPRHTPMVFVDTRIEYTAQDTPNPAILEERTHVYLTAASVATPNVRLVKGLPTESSFTMSFTPTTATLFRFSALTFNAHRIHLDREYAQNEGYPDCLVHGPLTALMLLEAVTLHKPDFPFGHFEYRAHNPLVVNRTIDLHVAWVKDGDGEEFAHLWAANENGVVGMSGRLHAIPR